MSAFLKIDECKGCHKNLPWDFVPAVLAGGRPLAGTGVWSSPLTGGLCPTCLEAEAAGQWEQRRRIEERARLVALLGGEKPLREFTFERFEVTAENRLGYQRSKGFNPATDNLYLWGGCGVGKTHLAWAAARRCVEESLSVTILRSGQISRKVRMKDPWEEEAIINELAEADTLVLDDVGAGTVTGFSRQVIQELLDQRDFNDRAGLIVTSPYGLDELAQRLAADAIPSRLAGLCDVIEVGGTDHRLSRNWARWHNA